MTVDDDRDDDDEPDRLAILRLVAECDQCKGRHDALNRRIAAHAARCSRLYRRMALEGDDPATNEAWASLIRAGRVIARRQAALKAELDERQARIDALADRLGVDLTQWEGDYIDE